MAVMVSGSQGGISLPSGVSGDNIIVFAWSGTLEHDKFDSTPFGDGTATPTNFKEQTYGMYDFKGTCQGWMLVGAVPSIGTAATINAQPVALFRLLTVSHATATLRRGYSFSAVVNVTDMSVVQSGQTSVTLTFESSGAVTKIADT